MPLDPILTPHGHLTLVEVSDAPFLDPKLAARLQDAFARGTGHALLQLGADEAGTSLPPIFSYWREFGASYVTSICTQPDSVGPRQKLSVPTPAISELDRLVSAAPPMTGAEYLTAEVLDTFLQALDTAFGRVLAGSQCALQDFLTPQTPSANRFGP